MLVMIAGRDPTRNAGGDTSYMTGLALAAQRAGYEPHMVALSNRAGREAAEFGTLHRIRSPARPMLAHSAPVHRPWLLPAVIGLLRSRPGPHVIHAHGAWTGAAVEAAARLNALGCETRVLGSFYASLAHEQGGKLAGALVRASPARTLSYAALVAWGRAVGEPYERLGYRRADAIAVNYENVRRLLVAEYGARAGVERIAYAAPAAFADERVSPDPSAIAAPVGAPRILTVSRHSARKGLDVLLRALAVIRDRGIDFQATIVGSGRMWSAHQALARDLGLGGRVRMPGAVPNVWPYLRACDVFALPSTRESSGSMSVLEALQAGVAIVSSAVDGIPEDLTDERDALLVEPGNATELADALATVLGDADLRERLRAGARATFEACFSGDRAADDLGRLYASLGLSPVRTPAAVERAGR